MKASIFVVSSDPFVRNQLGQFLMSRGHIVLFEHIGSKAILETLEQNIDIFILDLSPEDDSNWNVISIVKRTRPRLPIVVLSDNTSVDIVRKLSQAGIFYSAMKPVQIGEIEKVLEAIESIHQKYQGEL